MTDEQGRPMRIGRSTRRALAAAVASATVLLGAAALASPPSADARTGVTYTAKTVLVPSATVTSQLLSVSKNGATYTFKSKTGALSKLKAGKVMLLQNLAVRDVTKAVLSKGHFVVSSTPAELTDLIANGTLSWNKSISFAKGFAVGGPAVPASRSVAQRAGMAALASGGYTIKGKTHSYTWTANFDPSATGVAVTITIAHTTGVSIEAKIKGTIDNLKTAGNISVDHGSLSNAKLVANNLTGDFTLSYSAKPLTQLGLGDDGGIKVELPAEIAVPFFVGPIPMFLGVRTSIFASAGFSSLHQELSGSWSMKYDGAGGFTTSSSGATSPSGVLKGLGDIALSAANALRSGPISFVFGAQMPQLQLGLGIKGLNVAGTVTLVGSSGIASQGGGCDTRKMEVQGSAGAEANFFGFSAGTSTTLFDKSVYKAYPAGCGVFPG